MPSYIVPKKKEGDPCRMVHVFPVVIGKRAQAEALGYKPEDIESAGHFKIVDRELDMIEIKSGSYTLDIDHSSARDLADLATISDFLRM